MNIQASYSSTSIPDGLQYAITILKSRSQYLKSLRDFVIDPDIAVDEKMNLIESVSSENYGQKMREFLDPLPLESRFQEFQRIVDDFNENLEYSPMRKYDILVDILQLGLDLTDSTTEITVHRKSFQAELRNFAESVPDLNFEDFDQRAKLIAGYSYLNIPICITKFEKFSRKPELFTTLNPEITKVQTEFHRTELKVLEDLQRFLLTIMPEKDREFVKNFQLSLGRITGSNKYIAVESSSFKALEESLSAYVNSYETLRFVLKKLNSEWVRINNKINKKLCAKKIVERLPNIQKFDNLDEPRIKSEFDSLNYFLDVTRFTIVSMLEYVGSITKLCPRSQLILSEILQGTPKNGALVETALHHHLKVKDIATFFSQIYDFLDGMRKPLTNMVSQIEGPMSLTLSKMDGDFFLLDSYATSINFFILAETTQFYTELTEKLFNFTELLTDFDKNSIGGRKSPFQLLTRPSTPCVLKGNPKIEMELSMVDSNSDSKLVSQRSTLEDNLEQTEFSEETDQIIESERKISSDSESTQKIHAFDLKLETTEELDEKETQYGTAADTLMRSLEQSYKIYSKNSSEDEKLSYENQLNRKIKGKHLALLQTLYSTSPGEISFDDLKNLVIRCGGIIDFGRGSHFRITMPGRKVAFGFRPHGSKHSSKLRNLALESFRTALSDVRETVLVR